MSQLNRHQDALHHGKLAAKFCQDLILNTAKLSKLYEARIAESQKQKKLASALAAKSGLRSAKDTVGEDSLEKHHTFAIRGADSNVI